VLAAVSLKLKPDFATAIADMTRIGQVFMPEPEHVRTYEQLYRRVYCRMYKQLQPLYLDIQKITGYPKSAK
jgi:ribulose kinase